MRAAPSAILLLVLAACGQGGDSSPTAPTASPLGPSFAPRGAIQTAGLVLKKLDLSPAAQLPSRVLHPAALAREKGGRERLTDDVAEALHIMTAPGTEHFEICSKITNILNLATSTTTYFDITRTPNPAQEDFLKDWLKVQSLAGCT